MEEPKNAAVHAVESIIHGAIMDVALNTAILAAEMELPWLRLPVVKQIFETAAKLVFGYASKYMERAGAFATIDLQTDHQASEYRDAVEKLKGAKTDAEIEKAKQDMRDALGKLIHWDGS